MEVIEIKNKTFPSNFSNFLSSSCIFSEDFILFPISKLQVIIGKKLKMFNTKKHLHHNDSS